MLSPIHATTLKTSVSENQQELTRLFLANNCARRISQFIKGTEARSVILLLKNSVQYTKVDHHKWVLKRLFQPLPLQEDEYFQVLHCSNIRLASLIQAQNQRKARNVYTLESLPDESKIEQKLYRLMPHSRIITLSKKYRMVFLLDVTSSLATIDYCTEKIIISEVMDILKKCIEGLAQPFILQDLGKDRALHVGFFEPEISITVIAECSHFASNANIIPLLAGFPTMRVLLQGIIVTRINLPQIIEKLQDELQNFHQRVASFRQSLRSRDFAVAYVMDVAGPKSEEVADAAGSGKPLYDKKDNIWKLGSSGGNLSYSLNAGLFAVDLPPNEGLPALVLITDGVVKSNLAQMHSDDDILQRLCSKGVKCNIIQVGSSQGFNPGSNFGLVPDNEVLRFVAAATSGLFLYSSDCPDSSPIDLAPNKLASTKNWLSPNFYHKYLLMREFSFNKKKGDVRSRNIPGIEDRAIDVPRERFVNGDNHIMGYKSYKFFPWDPKSEPPAVEAIPTRYREYSLSIDVQQLVAARMRQGFTIDHVGLVENRNNNKAEKIHITMSRLWLPNVTIQYKIKAFWSGEAKGIARLKSPRIEINVLAYTMFAIYFVNFQTAQHNNDPSHHLFAKIIKMLKFLTTIYETDDLLKKHIFFKSPKEVIKTHNHRFGDNIWHISHSRLEVFRQFWDSLEQSSLKPGTRAWYDESRFDFLFAPSKSYPMPSSLAAERLLRKALAQMRERLMPSWATFSPSNNVYIKFIEAGEKTYSTIRFCELRLNHRVGYLWSVTLLYFNVGISQRQNELATVIDLISYPETNGFKESKEYIIQISKRPISRLFLTKGEDSNSDTDLLIDLQYSAGHLSIMQSYMRHYRLVWLKDLDEDVFFKDFRITPIQDLAFQYLCQARLEEGFFLFSEETDKQNFYFELDHKNEHLYSTSILSHNMVTGIQYQVLKDPYTGQIVTEIWMEPTQDINLRDTYDYFSAKIQATDRLKLSHLVTFDQIHYIATTLSRTRSTQKHNSGKHEKQPRSKKDNLPRLFDLPALLYTGELLLTNYLVPRFRVSPVNNKLNPPIVANSNSDPSKVSPGSSDTTNRSNLSDLRSPKQQNFSTSNRTFTLEIVKTQTSHDQLSISEPYRDSIAKLLWTSDRDFAMLHLFLETAFLKYSDGEIETTHDSCKNSGIWKEIKAGLSTIPGWSDFKTTIELIESLDDTKCFVKMVDSSSFILIIIPSFKVILNRMTRHLESFNSNSETSYLSFLLFLCRRPKASRTVIRDKILTQSDCSQTMTIQPISVENMSSFFNDNSHSPKSYAGNFSGRPVSFHLSDQATKVTNGIKKLYAHGFAQSIYASLLQKQQVDTEDFWKAINSCVESSIDIDITEYLNVHVQAVRKGLERDDEFEGHHKFMGILGHYFEPVTFIDYDLQNIHYYRPIIKKNTNFVEQDGVPYNWENFADVFSCAQDPLFIRLECTFKKAPPMFKASHPGFQLEDANFVRFPVRTLPTSYSCTVDGKFYDFSPESVGTEASPVASSDGTTATLHIICLTLPQVNEKAVNLSPSFVDLKMENISSSFEVFTTKPSIESLTPNKSEALLETRTRLYWLLKEEIIHGLLNSLPYEGSMLKYIQSQLESKNPFINYPTLIKVPISFVRKRKGQEKFFQEFKKADLSPYKLRQIDDCFYLSEDGESTVASQRIHRSSSHEFITSKPEASLRQFHSQQSLTKDDFFENDIVPDPKDTYYNSSNLSLLSRLEEPESSDFGAEYSENSSDEFCQGLGISMVSPEENLESDSLKNSGVPLNENGTHRPLFWLLLNPQDSFVQVFYFSKSISADKREDIIGHTKKCIEQVSVRVNQLILLDELKETHRCSKYLVAPSEKTSDSGSSSSSSSSSSSEDGDKSSGDSNVDMETSTGSVRPLDVIHTTSDCFKPGQFECKLVFRQTFPLHRRLKPGQALNGVASLVLDSFTVSNRKHMFVIAKGDYIVYLKLSEIGVQTPSTDYEVTIDESALRYGYSPFIHSAFGIGSEAHSTTPIIAPDDLRRSPSNKSISSRTSATVSPSSRKLGANLQPRVSESRELLMEVYGVDLPGREITEELVTLLDNKLTTNITLNVISTYLARTRNAKPTPADVEFILPVLKVPTRRATLKIPESVKDLQAFLIFLKQNLSLYLNVLNGADVTNTIKRHHTSRYGMEILQDCNTEIGRFDFSKDLTQYHTLAHHTRKTAFMSIDVYLGEFAFYYNCLQARIPSIEATIGQGISGICLTLTNHKGRPVFEFSPPDPLEYNNHIDFGKIINHFFEKDHPLFNLSQNVEVHHDVESSYNLLIELWSQGPLNSDALIERVKTSFHHTLCDYFVELSILKSLSPVSKSICDYKTIEGIQSIELDETSSPQSNQSQNLMTYFENHIQQSFVEPSLAILKSSASLENPAVQSLEMAVHMPAWIMDDLLREIYDLLTEVHANFSPVIFRRASSIPVYEIYRPQKPSLKNDNITSDYHSKFVLISGLRELSTRYCASKSTSIHEDRRSSVGSDRTNSRRSSIEDFSFTENSSNDKSVTNHSRKSSMMTLSSQQKSSSEDAMMLYTNTIPLSDQNIQQISHEIVRNCFMIMSLDGFTISVYSYNWQKSYSEQLFTALKNISNWHNGRMQLLNNILHQKMGLFYHIEGVSQNNSASTHMQFPSTPHTPRVLPSPKPGNVVFNNGQIPQHPEGSFKPQSSQRSAAILSQNSTDLIYVKSLIHERFPQRQQRSENRSEDLKKSTFISLDNRHDSETSAEKGTHVISTIPTLDLNEVLKDAFIEKAAVQDIASNERDALLRHGPPFMEDCISQLKTLQAYENVFKLCKKWIKRYQSGKDSISTPDPISKSDLAIIIQNSQLLHFCRTPVTFSGISHSSFQNSMDSVVLNDQHGSNSPKASNWYQSMIEKLFREYTAYLDKLGMQRVIFGKLDMNLADDHDKGFSVFASKSSVSENAPVDYPTVMLLKALQDGLIICEVKIQGDFICETLYTFYTRSRRLPFTAPGFEMTNGNRNRLKIFNEECDRFKKLNRFHSFIYDFFLKYFSHILEIPLSFNLLEMIKGFINRHPLPPSCAEHRIYHDIFEKVSPSIQKDLFTYIVKNPQRYGFSGINFEGQPIACFKHFEEKDTRNSDKKFPNSREFTLIFTSSDPVTNSGSLKLEYFIIVFNQNYVPFIANIPESQASPKLGDFIEHESRGSYIICVREILDSTIKKAIEYNGRDVLWRQLFNAKPAAATIQMKHEDFLILTQRWHTRDLTTINPDFKQILDLPLNWTDVLNFLQNYHADLARELHEGPHRHLMIFNPHNHDLLIQFVQNIPQGTLSLNTVWREARPNFEGFELRFAGDIARTVGYLLWEMMSSR
ncbi:hypothetical protein G9A89_007394 [Geosiphon pyriformis]|nr:hypothetical protein G9A89_007394 [Geosiphon pyriformis]